MSWKHEREHPIKHSMGRKICMVQKFFQNHRNFYRKDYLHVDVQRHLMVIKRQQGQKANQMINSFLYLQEDSGRSMVILRTWFREKWYSISEDSPQREWDRMAEEMMVTFAESGHPVFRATSPLSRGKLKSKGG